MSKKIWSTISATGENLGNLENELDKYLKWLNNRRNVDIIEIKFGECYHNRTSDRKGVMAMIIYTETVDEEK